MTERDSLTEQLLQLLSVLSKQGNLHLTEIDADLQQTTDLLSRAIDKLGKGFIGIHEAVAAQQAVLAGVPDGAAMTPQLRAEIARLQQITDSHIHAAVTALQFQDMTSQLIGRALGHVVGLREVFGTLEPRGIAVATAAASNQEGTAQALLQSVNATLADISLRQGTVKRKAVAQTHMESGDIELF